MVVNLVWVSQVIVERIITNITAYLSDGCFYSHWMIPRHRLSSSYVHQTCRYYHTFSLFKILWLSINISLHNINVKCRRTLKRILMWINWGVNTWITDISGFYCYIVSLWRLTSLKYEHPGSKIFNKIWTYLIFTKRNIRIFPKTFKRHCVW